ncbi:hypothetical protein PWT90_09405 [Aphanocladium album]|nr:hypothetical protein PWT90_09405 [Aphanocladium album]
MHFVTSLVAIGSVASLASASVGFEFPAAVPLSKRQTSGPAYECHANCGYTIQNSAQDGYCQDPKWKTLLNDCLDCALTYKIWQWYGDKVSAAAKACGLDATPKPAAGTGGASSSQAATTTAAPTSAPATENPTGHSTSEQHSQSTALQTSSHAEGTAPGTASGTSQIHSSTGAASHSSVATTTGAATTSAVHTNGTATTTHVQVGAASFQKPAMVAAGAVAAFAINMI